MTGFALRTRRMLLKDMGKAGTAVMIFGLAACSTESESSTTQTSGPTSTTDVGSTSSTRAQPTTTTTANASAGFHRANLGFVSAYILYRGGEAALVDTGVSDSEGAIEAALAEIGLGWDSIGHVVVTHHHGDHQGSLPAILGLTDAPWYAGAADMGAIAADGGSVVGDGDTVFDLEVIETPGHTAGHLSILDGAGGVLVTGDALNGTDGGGVTGANPQFSTNMDLANASVRKLAGFDYEVALFGHGEPILNGASIAVSALADAL